VTPNVCMVVYIVNSSIVNANTDSRALNTHSVFVCVCVMSVRVSSY